MRDEEDIRIIETAKQEFAKLKESKQCEIVLLEEKAKEAEKNKQYEAAAISYKYIFSKTNKTEYLDHAAKMCLRSQQCTDVCRSTEKAIHQLF